VNQNKKTIYILGAGASYDWNFSLGNELKTKISRMYEVNSTSGLFSNSALDREHSQLTRSNKFEEAQSLMVEASNIRNAMPLSFSIDNYLDSHSENNTLTFLGKLGIVRTILELESASKLNAKNSGAESFAIQNKCWHTLLFQSLVENCTFEQYKERLKNISFIIFNYDRVLEHYLLIATKIYFRKTVDEASKAINLIEFIHPYGQCGKLPWQDTELQNVKFGDHQPESIDRDKLLLKEIYTFTDKRNIATLARDKAQQSILRSDRIVILGFAFHPMNMHWLNSLPAYGSPDIGTAPYERALKRRVYASAMGIAEGDRIVIREMCWQAFSLMSVRPLSEEGDRIQFSKIDDDCSAFMSQFSLSTGYGNIL
jgi:hypothetical protein